MYSRGAVQDIYSIDLLQSINQSIVSLFVKKNFIK